MKNNYWVERFTQEEELRYKDARAYLNTIERQYDKVLRNIQQDITYWYDRIAKNNNVSLKEAKELLSKKELEEFKWTLEEYIQKGQENAISKQWIKQLENASARVHISKLESLKFQIQNEIEGLYGERLESMNDYLTRVYGDTYYKTAFITQVGTGIGKSLNMLDIDRINTIIHKPWAVDGKNFSERIWEDKTKLINSLHNGISQAFIKGSSLDEIIKNISKEFGVKKSVAGRLIMTETAAYSSQAKQKCFNDLDVEKYEIIATLDTSTSAICREMDGKIFSMKDYQVGITAPPFHPNCRTVTAPCFEDDINSMRAMRNKEGKTEYVSANMKYQEWYDKYVMKESEKNDIMKENVNCNLYKKYGEQHYKEIHNILEKSPLDIQKVWMKYEKDFKIVDINHKGTPHNTRGTGKESGVYLNLIKDSIGSEYEMKYSTTFHELGHHIDNIVGRNMTGLSTSMFSKEYKDGIFQKTIYNEIENIIKTYDKKLKAEFKAKGLKYYKYHAYDEFSKELWSLSKKERADLSDIVDGVTKGKSHGGFVHGAEYWKLRPDGVGSEAFAEMFDATINNKDSRKILEKYLPQSVKIFDEMIKEIGGV